MIPPKVWRPVIREAFENQPGIRHVVVDVGLDLLAAHFRIDRLGAALNGIGDAIEFRIRSSTPELCYGNGIAVHVPLPCSSSGITMYAQRMPVNPAVLEKASELDRAFAGAFDFIDRMRQIFLNKAFVGGVEENDRVIFTRPINPFLKLFSRRNDARRIIRRTQINQINRTLGQCR